MKTLRSLLVAKRLGELEGGKTLYGKLYLLISGAFHQSERKTDGFTQFLLLEKYEIEFPPESPPEAKNLGKMTTFYEKLAPLSQKKRKVTPKMATMHHMRGKKR